MTVKIHKLMELLPSTNKIVEVVSKQKEVWHD